MTKPLDLLTLDYATAHAAVDELVMAVEFSNYTKFVVDLNKLAETMGLPVRPSLVVHGFNDQARAYHTTRQLQHLFSAMAENRAPELLKSTYMEFISLLNTLMSTVESNQPAK